MTKLFLHYTNGSHKGPGGVVRNLIKGLSKTDIEVVRNLAEADIVGCLQHPGNDYNKLPRATVMGPNIFVLPDEAPEIWKNFNNYIVPCTWVKDLYQQFDIENKRNLNVWAVGVDTEEWSPKDSVKSQDCFIYYKNRSREDLIKVAKLLKDHKLTFKIIQYGNYQENQLKDLCNISKFSVLLDDTESQGLAVQQILSMNLPLFVVNKTNWEYKGKSYPATSVPYFSTPQCGTVCDGTDDYFYPSFRGFLDIVAGQETITFEPRRFIVDNFNLELKARDYLAILESSFGKN